MIRYSRKALALIDELRAYYVRKERIEALFSLQAALREAEALIERSPLKGLPAPRPYPELAAEGERWVLVRHYWIAYTTADLPIILAVFNESADIPRRFEP